ncbi:hypothetical protein CRM96_01750 [Enterococcus durans]|uniref:Uncharacterized protein n=1 Tax=Enterococcus durans TaxID=53345 RepID=A0AB36SBY4_9ENTE|nr:hypothetical protein CRM96_01750 [Enterococcus durans]
MSAYFRRNCFCSHRLFAFKEWDKSVSYFCPTLFSILSFSPYYSRLLFTI